MKKGMIDKYSLFFILLVLTLLFAIFVISTPIVSVNSPANNTASTLSHRFLNITVSNNVSNVMNVSIWGDNTTAPTKLLAYFENIANSTVTYNWTSPTIDTVFINDNDLRGYWKLDINASDLSGKAATRAGTAVNATLNRTGGKLGGAYEFDVSKNAILTLGDAGGISTNKMTLSIWAKSPDNTQSGSAMTVGTLASGGGSGYEIYNPDTSTIRFGAGTSGGFKTTDAAQPWDGNWHNIIGVYNTTHILIYVDGQLRNTTASTENIVNLGTDLNAGGWGAGVNYFNGTIDEIAIWNRSLTAAEITNIYQLQEGKYYWITNSTDATETSTSGTMQFAVDTIKPAVVDLRPILSNVQDTSQIIEIATNATDAVTIDTVFANITMPNASTTIVNLALATGNKYNNSYTIPSLTGLYNVTITANDTANNINNSITTNFTTIFSPNVTLISPANNSASLTGNITFNYQVNYTSSISNCSLTINSLANQTNTTIAVNSTQNFTLTNMGINQYNWSVSCTDAASNQISSPTIFVSKFTQTKFSGATTDLTTVGISNVSNFILDVTSTGRITFIDNVDLRAGNNFDAYVNITTNRIELNSSALPNLNVSARLTMNNLNSSNPRILRDGAICSSAICNRESYSSGTLVFNVTGFSVYSSEETPTTSETVSAAQQEFSPNLGELSPSNIIPSGVTFQVGVIKRITLHLKDNNDKPVPFPFVLYDSSKHSVVLNSIDRNVNQATITVSSTPRTEMLSINESKLFDLNEDGFYDTKIKLEKLFDGADAAVVEIAVSNESGMAETIKKQIEIKNNYFNSSYKKEDKNLSVVPANTNKGISKENLKFEDPIKKLASQAKNMLLYGEKSMSQMTGYISAEFLPYVADNVSKKLGIKVDEKKVAITIGAVFVVMLLLIALLFKRIRRRKKKK